MPITADELSAEIEGLPPSHALRREPASYRDGFIAAFVRVHGRRSDSRETLRQKFFIPHRPDYSGEQFVRCAAELSVANHVVQHSGVAEWEPDKQLKAPDESDVDIWFRVGPHHIALEVKCPQQETLPTDVPVLSIAGRHPERDRVIRELQAAFDENPHLPSEFKRLTLAKHKDTRLRDALESAHAKFTSQDNLDGLNVLLVACGDDLMEWLNYLYENQGLFTHQSFSPVDRFARVQVVIFSNLRYYHTICTAHHDWTLKSVFLLPCINPYSETRVTSETMSRALAIFPHHHQSFAAYRPIDAAGNVPTHVVDAVRIGSYVHGSLSDEEFSRFFPCTVRRGPGTSNSRGGR